METNCAELSTLQQLNFQVLQTMEQSKATQYSINDAHLASKKNALFVIDLMKCLCIYIYTSYIMFMMS